MSLIGRVLSEKTFKENEVFMIVRRIWFTSKTPKVQEIRVNTFLFTFTPVNDRNRVWNRRSYTINKSLIILCEWRPEENLEEVSSATTIHDKEKHRGDWKPIPQTPKV